MALSSPGIGSGLDINGLVGQLMALEKRPLSLLNTKEAKLQAQLSAYGSLKGALSSFQSAVAALASPARFSAVKASVADSTVLSASAAANASPGSFSIEVQTLAQAQKLRSGAFATTEASVGSGTLTIQFGSYDGGSFTLNPEKSARTIAIGSGQSSLAGVRDAINAADAGVTASIIHDGGGYRLVISSREAGLANALRITVADDDGNDSDDAGLSRLAFDASTGGTANLAQTVAAQNATLVIDGIAVSKPTNTVSDAIEGVTLNLLKEGTTSLSLARDAVGTQAAVESFVKAYNELHKTLSDLSKYDTANKKASILTGDATVRSVQSQLRGLFNAALSSAGGGLTTLAEVGVSFQSDGTLKLEAGRLAAALNDGTKDISTLFAAVGKPTDSLVSFVSSTAETKDGSYAVHVTQLATQGQAVGGGAAALTIVAGSNDTLNITVDGVAASVTLAEGTYTAASLAVELQSKINGASALSSAGIGVSVTESAGVLTVASRRYGSASSVSIGGGSAAADLFGTATETAGVDVAGSIGGATATGSGQTLTGTGEAAGLKISIRGGATGERGTIHFARGYADQLERLIGRMLESDGPVDGRMDGINASIKSLGARREVLERRLEMIEKRYRAQFTALDAMIASMTQTSNYLQQQLANLPRIGRLNE